MAAAISINSDRDTVSSIITHFIKSKGMRAAVDEVSGIDTASEFRGSIDSP